MKRIHCIVFFACFISSLLQAQQFTVLERKSGTMPDWLEPYVMSGDISEVEKIERFKGKYIIAVASRENDLRLAQNRANSDVVSTLARIIRSIAVESNTGSVYEFKDEISAHEVFVDDRSHRIEEDYWIKTKRSDTGIEVYSYYKLIALEETVLDQKIKQIILEEGDKRELLNDMNKALKELEWR